MMNSFIRTVKFLTCNQSKSTLLPLILYIIFITTILTITYPSGFKSPHQQHAHLVSLDEDTSSEGGELNRVFDSEKMNFEPQILSDNSSPKQILKFAFRKADRSGDGVLNIKELAKYINLRIRDHIDTSIKKNPQLFAEIGSEICIHFIYN